MQTDPEYAERRRALSRAAAARRLEKLRADPDAFATYRLKQRLAVDPEKRRLSGQRAQERRRARIDADDAYRERRRAIGRKSAQRRADRRREDSAYAQRIREVEKASYQRHRAEILEKRRVRDDARREEVRSARRRAYAKNPSVVQARFKRWKAANLERVRAWQRVADHRRRIAGPHFTAEEWGQLFTEHAGACAYCGATGQIEADHRVPISRGGSNAIDNILPACRWCNRSKGAMTEEEFRERMKRDRDSLAEAPAIYRVVAA